MPIACSRCSVSWGTAQKTLSKKLGEGCGEKGEEKFFWPPPDSSIFVNCHSALDHVMYCLLVCIKDVRAKIFPRSDF